MSPLEMRTWGCSECHITSQHRQFVLIPCLPAMYEISHLFGKMHILTWCSVFPIFGATAGSIAVLPLAFALTVTSVWSIGKPRKHVGGSAVWERTQWKKLEVGNIMLMSDIHYCLRRRRRKILLLPSTVIMFVNVSLLCLITYYSYISFVAPA